MGLTDPYDVLYLVASELDVTPLGVLSKDRHHPLPMARQISAWLLVKKLKLSRSKTARLLDVSYGTVAYYLRNVDRRRRNGEWSKVVARLSRRV